VQVPFGVPFIDAKSAANTQAHFRAIDAFYARNAELKAAGQPEQSRDAFDKAWDAAHPPVPATLDAVLDEIDYGVKLIGVDHVGIGSDFDGVDGELPEGLRTTADFPNLVAGLRGRGYRDDDIRKILGGNLLRVWSAIEDGAAKR